VRFLLYLARLCDGKTPKKKKTRKSHHWSRETMDKGRWRQSSTKPLFSNGIREGGRALVLITCICLFLLPKAVGRVRPSKCNICVLRDAGARLPTDLARRCICLLRIVACVSNTYTGGSSSRRTPPSRWREADAWSIIPFDSRERRVDCRCLIWFH